MGDNEPQTKIDHVSDRLSDLIEYLERKGIIEGLDMATFTGWEDNLAEMRREEKRQMKIREAKDYLESEGLLVVSNPNELDAARLKKWVQSKEGEE